MLVLATKQGWPKISGEELREEGKSGGQRRGEPGRRRRFGRSRDDSLGVEVEDVDAELVVLLDLLGGDSRRRHGARRAAAEVGEDEDAHVGVGPPGPIPPVGRVQRTRRSQLRSLIRAGRTGDDECELDATAAGKELVRGREDERVRGRWGNGSAGLRGAGGVLVHRGGHGMEGPHRRHGRHPARRHGARMPWPPLCGKRIFPRKPPGNF